jgi:hypothetical protein
MRSFVSVVTAAAFVALAFAACTDPEPAPLARVRVTPTSGLETHEDGTVAMFEVVLTSEPTAEVVIPIFSDAPEVALTDVDSLTFHAGNWSRPQTVVVRGRTDQRIGGDRLYHVMLDPAQSEDLRYQSLEVPDVTLTSVDTDRAGAEMTTPGDDDQTIREGTSVDLSFTLATRPTAPVHVTLAVDYPDMHLDTTEIEVLASEWNFPHHLTLSTDAIHSEDVRFATITATARSSDTDYDGADLLRFVVTVIDRDLPGLTAALTGPDVISQNGGETTIAISLDSPPSRDVAVPVVAFPAGNVGVTPATVVFHAFEQGPQTVVVKGKVNSHLNDVVQLTVGPSVSDDASYDGLSSPSPIFITVFGR